MNLKRFVALALIVTTCLTCIMPASAAFKEETPLRVLLRRLNITDRVDVRLDGAYTLGQPGEDWLVFSPGSEVTVMLSGGQLHVYYEGMRFNAGTRLCFTRHQYEGAENGLRLQTGTNLYEGDLYLSAGDTAIQAVLHIGLEDYLLGVVPYEMSDSFPMEALKVQAVAARTYAAQRMGSSGAYDVVDTTNDQVFKGMDPQNVNARQAVTETKGQLLYDGKKLANCYYSASNGGQTDKASHVWEGVDFSYLVIKDDPYDVANPFSTVKTFNLSKQGPYTDKLTRALAPYLKESLVKAGYSGEAENLQIERITAAQLTTPKFKDTRLMTQLEMTLEVSARRLIVPLAQVPDEEVYFLEPVTATSTPEPQPQPTPYYSSFAPLKEPVTITVPLFGEMEQIMGLAINSTDNELITLTETDEAYRLESRRFGHGVGMSQRGAEWMAGNENMTYKQILDFYYPGTQLKTVNNTVKLPVLDAQLQTTPGPRPTAIPRPTLMPVTQTLPEGAWYATVTEIDDDSTLNLRAEPNTGCDIIMRLYKHQQLIVLEECQEEGWVKVKTDVTEGYVMASYLTQEKD